MPRVNIKGYGTVNFPDGMAEDEMKTAIDKLVSGKANVVDEEPQQDNMPSGATGSFGDDQSPYEKYGVPGLLFPRTSEATEKGGNFGERALSAVGDILTIPQRTIAGGATLAGFNQSAPESTPYKKGLQEAAKEFSRYKPTEDTKGVTKFAQEMAYDPTLIPGLAVGATEAKLAAKALGFLKAAVPAVSGAAQAGLSSGIRQSTEGEFDLKETGKAAGLGAALPAAGAGLTYGAKKVMGETGKRLIQALIRPGQKGMKEGFDADYIMKDKEILKAAEGGIETLQRTLKDRFNNLSKQVNKIQKTTGKDVQIDVPSVYHRISRKLNASSDFTGMKPELIDALDGLKKNLSNKIEEFDEFTDLATAMKLRTNYGTKVNWLPGISGSGRKAAMEASAEEKVYDSFYKELSAEIKKQAPEEIKKIDAEYSKLIPVLKAANRRVLIETSNLPIGLMETVGGTGIGATAGALSGDGDVGERVKRGLIGAAAGVAVTKGLKSPKLGGVLYKTGKSLSVPPAVTTATPTNTLLKNLEDDEKEKNKKKKNNSPSSYMKGHL
jgi:hypothetical protein